MKKRLAAFMAAMSMTAVMVGCGQEDPILGTWKADKVKASGGIRTLADAEKMILAGADRLGASAGVQIVEESRRKEGV